MDERIFEPNDSFVFENIILAPPTAVGGGNYFIRCLVNESPLYIQPPKCKTKQNILKSGKKMYCDLMFTNENEGFIRWMENLENYIYKAIYANREKWFETDLELDDIENSFTPPLKLYKSGKFYIARTNVPMLLGKCVLKIYNEKREEVDIEKIGENTNVITILEIQGIKCSTRSFQIEIEVKQMMMLKASKIFDNCIIQPKHLSYQEELDIETETIATKPLETTPNEEIARDEEPADQEEINVETEVVSGSDNSLSDEALDEPTIVEDKETEPEVAVVDQKNTMTEVDLTLDNLPEDDVFTLKKRTDVYYEMYREARRKAKEARNLALSAYLEAKRIKNTYMLDDLKDSDESDLDEEGMDFEEENDD
jgi:hypothetical protein